MRGIRVVLAFGLAGIGAGCSKDRSAEAAADSVRMADSVRVADSVRAAQVADSAAVANRTAGGKPATPARENIVDVVEQTPGLLAQAKLIPIDAQHLALTKFPEGAVKSATIERRGGDLVYAYQIQLKDVSGTEEVVVNAMDGKLITSIHRDAKKP